MTMQKERVSDGLILLKVMGINVTDDHTDYKDGLLIREVDEAKYTLVTQILSYMAWIDIERPVFECLYSSEYYVEHGIPKDDQCYHPMVTDMLIDINRIESNLYH